MSDLQFYYNLYRRDISNLSFLRHHRFSGFIVSMHQSGTHWLKHMLASAISNQLNIDPPRYAYAGDMIGGTKDPVSYPGIPLFGHSHTIPSILASSGIFRKLFTLPDYVILVRDFRPMLVSHYEKWKDVYQCEFSEYLRGDLRNNRFRSDIWWCIRFQNAWGRVNDKFPGKSMVMKYEDMTRAPREQLSRINDFLRLGLSESAIIHGIDESTKEKMAAKPTKPKHLEKKKSGAAVRIGGRTVDDLFSTEDKQFLSETCRKYLKYNFGYQYDYE